MNTEIERKFLVVGEGWRSGEGILFRQGYLSTVKERTVRVRIEEDHAFITIKGVTTGVSRAEFEYEIPVSEAEDLLKLCEQPLIEKRRFTIIHEEKPWEVDEFFGENTGLIVAEIELNDEAESFATPDWLGPEVSNDLRYYNANLVSHPFAKW